MSHFTGNYVVVVGAGGHAKVCIELLRAMGEQVPFCIGTNKDADSCLDVPVLKGDDYITKLRRDGYSNIFIAIGGSHLRQKLSIMAIEEGYTLVNAISPLAAVSPTVKVGRGVAIMAGAVVNADTSIGDLVIVNTSASIDHDCEIGDGAHIAPQCGLAGNVHVGMNTTLGVGTKVIPGISIGSNVTIGAGGVVIADVPDGVTAVGVPVRVITGKI